MTDDLDETPERDYIVARDAAVDALVTLFQCAERIGRDQSLVMGEFMGAFQQAAEKAAA